MRSTTLALVGAVSLAAIVGLSGCSSSASATAGSGKIVAVGAENEYADVISQVGGKYVAVSSVMSNPNTDPHTFEASASVARTVSSASLVVQNGVGYDSFMNKIEAASGGSNRTVIVAQKLLGLPDDTANPHLWYKPSTMPAVAKAVVAELTKLQPGHKAYFEARLAKFTASMSTWTDALAKFKSDFPGTPVAVTEPVADYALQAAGADIKTPFSLQASIMNDTDPSPQDSAMQNSLFTDHKVKVFLYNQQVTDDITTTYLNLAHKNKIPVVGVYETMPTNGYTYQSWMLAELDALRKAVTSGTSTEKL
jgi:zinc/manganese transport system substrate-binding protein